MIPIASSLLLALMILSSLVLSTSKDISVDWIIPSGDSLPGLSAVVGDTVTFTWQGMHNVLIHPSGTCDEMNAVPVGSVYDGEAGSQYTFVEEDANIGKVTFACDVGDHCESGQIITFIVAAMEDAEVVTKNETVSNGLSPPGNEHADDENHEDHNHEDHDHKDHDHEDHEDPKDGIENSELPESVMESAASNGNQGHVLTIFVVFLILGVSM